MRAWLQVSHGVSAALLLVLGAGRAHAQSESPPTVDTAAGDQGRLQASTENVQEEAWFGYTMASGKLQGATDLHDDVVICAPQEDNGTGDNVGAAYVFLDEHLTPPTNRPKRLLPTNPNNGSLLGILAIKIGNPRGLNSSLQPYSNLILIGCSGHDAKYPGYPDVTGGGSVEMYDWFAATSATDNSKQKSLFAPLNPPGTTLYDGRPQEVHLFGHGLDIGDVTGDGVDDLVVGAPGAWVEEARDVKGRVYIFQGHGVMNAGTQYEVGDFYAAPGWHWTGIDAVEPKPDPDPPCSGATDCEDWGQSFGTAVSVCHFTDTAAREVLVGRSDRSHSATEHAVPNEVYYNEPRGGSGYVLRGSWLASLCYGLPYDPDTNPDGTLNRVNRPPWPNVSSAEGGLDEDLPEYQVIRNPFGDSGQASGSGPNPAWSDGIGWIALNGGDLGSLDGTLDTIDDGLLFGDEVDYIGTGSLNQPQVSAAGGVWVVYGTGMSGTLMVYDDDLDLHDHGNMVLLQRPLNVGTPQQGARFGRAMARADEWYNPLTDELEPGLFIGELNATSGGQPLAGRMYLIRLALPAPTGTPLHAVNIANAWGTSPLTEHVFDTNEAGPRHLFGSWISVLDYRADNAGQELIVSARQADVKLGSSFFDQAGRAVPYVPPSQ